jgi:ankyrin repeat protein
VLIRSGEADNSQNIKEFARAIPDPLSDKKYIPDPHDGTCQWFLDLPEYQDWNNTESTTLYVIGDPGVGKTVLANFLIDELRKHENPEKRIIYFFCKHQNKNHTSAVSILRSLIHQCMRLIHSLWEKHVQHRYVGFGPKLCDSFGELCEIFAAIMSDTEGKSGDWYCVIDALDNCEEDERKPLLENISNIRSRDFRTVNSEKDRLNLRLLVTSRPCESIRADLRSMRNTATICFTDGKGESRNKHDIERYIEDKVTDLVKQNGSVRDREDDVKKALINGHEGVFKWASCMVTTLKRPDIDDVDDALKQTPPDIDDMFKSIKYSIQHRYKPLLEWVALTCRDLSVRELSVALKLNAEIEANNPFFSHSQPALDVERIKNMIWSYGGLLKIQDEKVILLHQSVKKFLVAQHFKDQLQELHAKISKACIIYLSGEGLEQEPLKGRRKSDCRNDYEKLCEKFPFLEYAASSWYKHAQEAGHAGMDLADLWIFTKDRFATKPIMELSFQVNQFSNRQEYISGQMCLHILVHHSLLFFAEKWLDTKDTDPNVVDVEGRTPLWWAAERNNVSMVKLLLTAERINPNSKEKKRGLSPLSVAVENGLVDVVRILLEDKRVEQGSHDHDGRTPLSLAAGAGNVEVAQLLLEKEDVRKLINSKDTISDQTPLLWAARKGHVSVVEVLLKKQASPNFKDSERGRTSLVWAAVNGHRAVVAVLLKEKEVDLFLRDGEGWSALEWAAFCKEDIIANEILDEAHKRLDKLDDWAKGSIWEFLNPAAKFCKEAAMKLLLERDDIDPNSPGQDGRTALSLAAEMGHVVIVQQLLDSRKVCVNAGDADDGQTPLHWAAKFGREEIVKLLLKRRSVDLNARDIYGTPAWKLAKDYGYRGIANSILERMR